MNNWRKKNVASLQSSLECIFCSFVHQGMYIKSTYDGLHVITGTTEGVRVSKQATFHKYQ